jgi:hypothetical protein
MKLYYVNSFPNRDGEYEVHEEGCKYLPNFLTRKFLDYLPNAKKTINKAKKNYPSAKACKSYLLEYYSTKK